MCYKNNSFRGQQNTKMEAYDPSCPQHGTFRWVASLHGCFCNLTDLKGIITIPGDRQEEQRTLCAWACAIVQLSLVNYP